MLMVLVMKHSTTTPNSFPGTFNYLWCMCGCNNTNLCIIWMPRFNYWAVLYPFPLLQTYKEWEEPLSFHSILFSEKLMKRLGGTGQENLRSKRHDITRVYHTPPSCNIFLFFSKRAKFKLQELTHFLVGWVS